MFGFINKVFVGLLSVCLINFSESIVSNSKGLTKHVSLSNQSCQARPMLVDINSDETFLYIFTTSVSICGGSCDIIDYPYALVFVPNEIKKYECKSISFNVWGKWKQDFS